MILNALLKLNDNNDVRFFFFSSRRRHTRFDCDWSSDVCSSDLIGDKGVFETFERMAEQIEHEERKLIAAAEVNEDLTGDRLVKQFQALEVKADADQQLLDLKRKLGLLPAGSPAEAQQLGQGAAQAELVEDDDAEHHP